MGIRLKVDGKVIPSQEDMEIVIVIPIRTNTKSLYVVEDFVIFVTSLTIQPEVPL